MDRVVLSAYLIPIDKLAHSLDETNPYALIDLPNELRGKDIQLKLMWKHMQLTRNLFMEEDRQDSSFHLPDTH